jgi:hypothetical protein
VETIACGNCGSQAGRYDRFCTTCGHKMPGSKERALARPPPPPEPPPPRLLPLVCLCCGHEMTPRQAFEPRFGFSSGLRDDGPPSPPKRDPREGSPRLHVRTNFSGYIVEDSPEWRLEDPVESARRENAMRAYSDAWPKRPGYGTFLEALWLLPCPACGVEDPMRISIAAKKSWRARLAPEPSPRDE